MAQTKAVEIVLSCGSWQEADTIANALLKEHLVACVEFFPIKSRYWWKQALEEAEEIKLSMHSLSEHFPRIEAVVNELHSYSTPVLQAMPVAIMNEQAMAWLTSTTTKNE